MKDKKNMQTFVTGLCLLGMGLGVNFDEAWAGMKRGTPDKVSSSETELPAVQHDKWIDNPKLPAVQHDKWIDSPKLPAVQHDKWVGDPQKPSVEHGKWIDKPSADFTKTPNPSVNRVKPVPANKLPR